MNGHKDELPSWVTKRFRRYSVDEEDLVLVLFIFTLPDPLQADLIHLALTHHGQWKGEYWPGVECYSFGRRLQEGMVNRLQTLSRILAGMPAEAQRRFILLCKRTANDILGAGHRRFIRLNTK